MAKASVVAARQAQTLERIEAKVDLLLENAGLKPAPEQGKILPIEAEDLKAEAPKKAEKPKPTHKAKE